MEKSHYNIFISCKSEDYTNAEPVYHWLKTKGHNPFFAPISLKISTIHGEPVVFSDEIDTAIEEAENMIVFTSKSEYVKTGYVKDEWRTFVEEQRAGRKSGSLVTILDGVNVAELPLRLRSVQSFTPSNYKEGILRFMGNLPEQIMIDGTTPAKIDNRIFETGVEKVIDNNFQNILDYEKSNRRDNDYVLEYSEKEFNSLIQKGNYGDICQPFILPVEDVFYIKGRGIAVTGKIESGEIHVGDNVVVVGYGKEESTICLGIEMHRNLLDKAETGDEIGLLLKGLNKTDVHRGQVVITTPTVLTESKSFSCDCHFFDSDKNYRISGSQSLKFYFRAVEVSGRLELQSGVNYVTPNDYLPVRVNLIDSVPLNKGLVFGIRLDNNTIGVGIVKNVY